MLDVHRILASRLVAQVDHQERLGSTSDRAIELATGDAVRLPLLVIAERQTAGRGRGNNQWWSSSGALTFSVVVEAGQPLLPPARRPLVALVAGLAVCEALEQFVPRAALRVKWPNDVFAADKKVCGILCESVPGCPDRLVVGVGINVNNSVSDAPKELRLAASAMIDLDGRHRDLTEVLLAVLDRLDLRWRQLLQEDFGSLAVVYNERCLLVGKTVTVVSGSRTIIGRCQGIDAEGSLILWTEQGPVSLVAGHVQHWEPEAA